jgi:hypothetical protein
MRTGEDGGRFLFAACCGNYPLSAYTLKPHWAGPITSMLVALGIGTGGGADRSDVLLPL